MPCTRTHGLRVESSPGGGAGTVWLRAGNTRPVDGHGADPHWMDRSEVENRAPAQRVWRRRGRRVYLSDVAFVDGRVVRH